MIEALHNVNGQKILRVNVGDLSFSYVGEGIVFLHKMNDAIGCSSYIGKIQIQPLIKAKYVQDFKVISSRDGPNSRDTYSLLFIVKSSLDASYRELNVVHYLDIEDFVLGWPTQITWATQANQEKALYLIQQEKDNKSTSAEKISRRNFCT